MGKKPTGYARQKIIVQHKTWVPFDEWIINGTRQITGMLMRCAATSDMRWTSRSNKNATKLL